MSGIYGKPGREATTVEATTVDARGLDNRPPMAYLER